MDLRIEKTYRALISSFTELLEEKRYEDITVSTLCDRALIRRTTFYKHFADKDEFFRFFLLNMRDEFEKKTHAAMKVASVREYQSAMSPELVRFLKEHSGIVDNVQSSSMSGVLFDALADVMERDVLSVLVASGSQNDASDFTIKLQAAYLAGGTVAALKHWWKCGHDDAHVDALIDAMLQGAQGF